VLKVSPSAVQLQLCWCRNTYNSGHVSKSWKASFSYASTKFFVTFCANTRY
jgi:hypothetical protein